VRKFHGPPQSMKSISDDGLKLLRRGIAWGIKPTYRPDCTRQEVEQEMKLRKIPLKQL
jgi:hypothetical protein